MWQQMATYILVYDTAAKLRTKIVWTILKEWQELMVNIREVLQLTQEILKSRILSCPKVQDFLKQ
jgi:hypothetical protein